MENADIILRKLHNNEIDDVPIEEGNIIFDKDTKQMLVDDEDNGVGKRLKYGGSEKLIDVILTANTTTKTVYDDTITTDSIIRIYVDEEDSSFTYNSLSTSNGSVTITFNAMTQDVPIKVGIGAVSEFHQLITEGQASDISYNNSQSGMTATDVQEAIDELKSDLGNIELTADNVEYDNTTSGLQATNVQGAVDEITDNLSGFKFYPTGTSIVGLIADDSAYTDENGNYVVWGTATSEQLVADNPNTYKSIPSTEDTRGEVGADSATPFSSLEDINPTKLTSNAFKLRLGVSQSTVVNMLPIQGYSSISLIKNDANVDFRISFVLKDGTESAETVITLSWQDFSIPNNTIIMKVKGYYPSMNVGEMYYALYR